MKRIYPLFVFIFSFPFLQAQNTPPVAVKDSLHPYFGHIMSDTLISYYVTENDFDAEGDAFEIVEVWEQGSENQEVQFSDSLIDVEFRPFWGAYKERVFHYRLRGKNDTTQLSNWTTLYINPGIYPEYPIAFNDTIIIYPGVPAQFNLLANDIHPLGDSMQINQFGGGIQLNDSIVEITIHQYETDSIKKTFYLISDTSDIFSQYDVGLVYMNVQVLDWYDSLNINNINARFNCFGMHFWNLDNKSHFKVPNGSNISSLFSQSFWIGGLDDNNDLHVAAERYRSTGEDFWPGPVSTIYDSVYDRRWLHVWKLNRIDIDHHKANWWTAVYEPIPDILTWPGNGDTERGQSELIAPFEDQNNNGIYEPMLGDAPIIKGDQALFFVFNDAREPHMESGGVPLGIEIHAMAYAFDTPEDSALWNTVFLHYDIKNCSDTSYHDVYLGVFTDTDLGYGWDDRIECDVEKGMYFTFNGEEVDGNSGYPGSYGEHPPAQGIQFLGGPFMEPDGIDNPKFDALGNQIIDESINGLNFGDGIVDNERMGMTSFIYFNSGGNASMSDPIVAPDFYKRIQAIWNDETKMQYGGYGHPSALAEGPDANFMFPRDTDPYNWGTYGLWPNGGFNQNDYYWTEEIVGANPSDRRGLGNSGPFTLAAGQTQSLDIALTWARDYAGTAWSSAELLKERAAGLREKFQNDPRFFSKIGQMQCNNHNVLIFPNPVINEMKVRFPETENYNKVAVYSLFGLKVMDVNIKYKEQECTMDCTKLPPGVYILQLKAENHNLRTKFIKK